MKNYFTLSAQETLNDLQSSLSGLSLSSAAERQKKYGPNALPSAKVHSWFQVFFRQFLNPLIYVLIAVAILSIFLKHYSDAGFIFLIITFNAVIGAFQEYGAEKSAAALKKMTVLKTLVLREDKTLLIDSEELVPGDIVILEAGNRIPADLRLLESSNLYIDESLLTGESLAVEKIANVKLSQETVLADRVNMSFAATLVTRGKGKGIVTATGYTTELGKIAETLSQSDSTETPLIQRMKEFSTKIALIFSVIVILIGVGLFLTGHTWIEVVMVSVALGVAAIPEALPVALTVALSIASRKMSKRNVIVRQLAAVEALGSCTFIATDKTGTLTVNELTIRSLVLPRERPWQITGSGVDPNGELIIEKDISYNIAKERVVVLARVGSLCNDAKLEKNKSAWESHGDAVDIAFLVLSEKLGLSRIQLEEKYKRIAEIPFDSEAQFAATLHHSAQGKYICVKGGIEKVLNMCDKMATLQGEEPIAPQHIEQQSFELAKEGYRVLALAAGHTNNITPEDFNKEHPAGLTFLGLVGMIDPLRPDAKEAVSHCHEAGIKVAMITGDHPATAYAISKELGLANNADEVVTGLALKQTKNEIEFDSLVKKARVFARVEPQQKYLIVKSLIRNGHFVAVTGDGANDAPALKEANVGVAMGKMGTEVAKETANLIISDDKFSSIVAGVEEGRIAYSNIRKVVYMVISTGMAEIVFFVLSLLFGLPLPLTAVQLLWLNIVTNGIQDLGLAFEPGEGDELKQSPRSPRESILNTQMLERVAIAALLLGGIGFSYYNYLIKSGIEHLAAQNLILLLMVLFENILIGSCRSEKRTVFSLNPFKNLILLLGTLGAQLLHIFVMHFPPIGKFLGVQPISFEQWIEALAIALGALLLIELHKILRSRAYS